MANQYSNYTLAPYVSQYVNPYSVEVNTLLRGRYDQNKANKDKIDATLGAWNTLPGDAHIVDKAKDQTRNKLSQFIEFGNYEDAGMMIGETMVDLESDKGLQLSKQSYDIRQQELAYMREATIKNGTQFLDFGRNSINTHQSYYKDKDGKFVENVYQPTNEAMQDYDGAMKGLVGNIKADYTGISRGKADRIAEALIPTYLNSTEGDQDYRRLTEIDGMSHKEALNNIRQRLQSFTDQQIHATKAAATQNGAAKMYGNSIIKGYTAMKQTDQMNLAQYWNKTLDANSTIFSNFEAGNYGDVPKQAKDVQRVLNAQAKASLSPAEYAEWKKHNIDLWKGHEEFGALVNYSTTNTYMPDFETQEDFEVGEMAAWGGGAAVAAGAGMLTFGVANAWNPLGWGVLGGLAFASLIGMGANAVTQTVEKGYLSEKGNVRDMMNTDQGDGALFGLLDSQSEELQANLEDTEWVNKLLGTNYKNGDPVYEQLKKNAQASLLYRQQGGGDEHDDMIHDYKGDIFEAQTYVPDYTNSKLIGQIENIEENFTVDDWNFLGMPEGSDAWKDMMTDSNGKKVDPGNAKIKFQGIIAPSIDDDTPLMFKWNVNGKTYIAESKENGRMNFDLEEMISMDMNQGQLVVEERARQWVNDRERQATSEHELPTKQELVETLNLLYQNIVGMDDATAQQYAEQYMIKRFEHMNPTLIQLITAQQYGEGKKYEDLTPTEKESVDREYTGYYHVYKQTEVR
jgi:hypothetical protein